MSEEMTLEKNETAEKRQEPEKVSKLVYGTHINENEESVEIITEVAGYNQDDLEITVESLELRISSRKAEAKEDGRKLVQREFNREGYNRMFRLSDKIDTEGISAEVKDGVLKIRLPKAAPAQRRQIEVKAV